jgi:glycosyltransferase involved in cell wall biosynthesis
MSESLRAPDLSVVIPTYNRPAQLQSCLSSLAASEYPRDRFEVIIVDDGGQTDPEPTVARFRSSMNVSLMRIEHAGPAAARNAGARRARGDYLVFTDDDCVPSPEWLGAIADGMSRSPRHMIGGTRLNAFPENQYSAASHFVVDYVQRHLNEGVTGFCFCPSNNLALPRKRFLEMNGFDTTFSLAAGEDRELCDRWLQEGNGISQESCAIVSHAHWLTRSSFLRQHFNYGRGSFHFHQVRGRPLESWSFYSRMILAALRRHERRQAWKLAVLLVLSQLATAAGYCRAWSQERRVVRADWLGYPRRARERTSSRP